MLLDAGGIMKAATLHNKSPSSSYIHWMSAYQNVHNNIHITKPPLGFGQLLASAESCHSVLAICKKMFGCSNWTTHTTANNDKKNQTAESTCQTRFWILFGMLLIINDSMTMIHLQEHQTHFKKTEVPCLHWPQTRRALCWQGHLVQKHFNWNSKQCWTQKANSDDLMFKSYSKSRSKSKHNFIHK